MLSVTRPSHDTTTGTRPREEYLALTSPTTPILKTYETIVTMI